MTADKSIKIPERTTKPDTPGAGEWAFYFKSTGMFIEDDAGVETGPFAVGGISGSTGATDNALLRADGTGGATVQSSTVIADDSGNVSAVNTLGFVNATELTIATGAITRTATYHRIDTEADAASDDLDTISGGTAGQKLIIRAENTARTVVVRHIGGGSGNIRTFDGSNVSLDETYKALELIYDGTNWLVIGVISGTAVTSPQTLQQALSLRWLANDKILIGMGSVAHGTTMLNKTTGTVLTMGTAGDWIDGASGEAASAFAHVYANSSGTLKLHDTMPNNSGVVAGTYVATMRVNQAGWNGTAGSGLDATSVVYDTDTGEGSVTAGMLLGVYSDSAYTLGRGKGSAASATLQNMSFALITAIDTGTNTLTLEAGHQIALNDNDFLIVIQAGPVVYRDESGTVWRWLGAIFNNSGSNLDSNRYHNNASYRTNEGSDYTTTSSSFGAIDSTNFNHTLILDNFAYVDSELNASGQHSSASAFTYFDLAQDTVRVAGDDGLIVVINPDAAGGTRPVNYSFESTSTRLLPGTHTFQPQWKTSAATATLFAGAATGSRDTHSDFSAEIRIA